MVRRLSGRAIDDHFEGCRQRKPCGFQMQPEDQVRVVGRQFVLCFHCAMISLNLKALGEGIRVDVSLALLRRLEDGQFYDHEGRVVLAYWRVER